MKKRKKDTLQKLEHIIEEGERKQVDWSKAKFILYQLDTNRVKNEQMKSVGVKNLTGAINFSSNDSLYQLSFDNLIYLPLAHSWFEGQFKEVIHKGEQFTPDMWKRWK